MGRRSRACVDDLHVTFARDGRELEGVRDKRDRIFGSRRNADQFAAGRLEVRLKTTAGGGNQSEPPGAADCFGYFKRSPLDPASVQLRGYLQNCQVVTFLQCSPFARYPPVSAKPMFDNGFA